MHDPEAVTLHAEELLAEAQALVRRAAALLPQHVAVINGVSARLSQVRSDIAGPRRYVG
ncbi:hypothetical protein [Arenibaculum pallidiluteum]|uniref:hypothetical protein n=1 Tax=Arenibaculum pallidiluteum TaxID=2812559 RepID=UPI001A970069|nr:hypothetical protein [Arenibaculum pallidiluteum]